jgi:SpoVK/Ycf46/Vps4 family AAA+-type ATPase
MTIATTNHLENLDVAIRDRPSRFDEKILFDNPDLETRKRYLSGVIVKWQLVVSPEQLDKVSNETNGFSFAGLQELTRSALMNSLRNSQDPFSGLIKVPDEQSEKKKKRKKKSS